MATTKISSYKPFSFMEVEIIVLSLSFLDIFMYEYFA